MNVGELIFLGKEGRRIYYRNNYYTIVITLSSKDELLNIKAFPLDREKYQIGVISPKRHMCKLLRSSNASMEELERIVNSKEIFAQTVEQVFCTKEIATYLEE